MLQKENQVIYDHEKKIWSGPIAQPIHNSNTNLGYLISNVLKQTPKRVTQVSADTDMEMTCHEMRLRTMKIASHLMIAGYKQNDVVGVMATNSENLAPTVFACFALGLPINTLAPVMIESDIIHMFSKTKPAMVLCDASLVQTVRKAADKLTARPTIYTLMSKVDGYQFIDDILKVDFDESEFV